MASSKTGIILNLLRQTNFRLIHPIHFRKGLAHSSVRSGDIRTKKTTKAEADYQVQKAIVAEFLEKGNLAELDLLKEQVLNAGATLNKFTFDAHFIGICSELGAFELGRDYFMALHSKGNTGVGAVSRYFTMCHAFPDKFGPSEQELMLKVYDELLKKYDVLDVSTCESVAQGIGLTERWRTEIPRLLDMINHSGMSPSPTLWITAIESAIHHQDHKVAWEFMDAYANSGKLIMPKLYEIVLKQKNILPQLLRWLQRHGIIMNVESAEVFMRLAPSHGATTKSSLVSRKGSCKACRRSLEPSHLTPEDFELLCSAFLDPVLVGRDVFQKTSPQELNSFHKFLEKVLPVDVVLDGLNIAYVRKKLSPNGAKLLRFVTSRFVSEGCKILVVGRKHMDRWSTKEMNYVKSNASVFLAENTSQDDPLLLYAALKSGIGTKFVSRDRMTSHRFLLREPHLRHIFSKWQALHQYHPLHISEDGNTVALRPPSNIAREPQQTSTDVWHLPVVDHSQANVEGHLQDETAPWLCLSNVPFQKPKEHQRNAHLKRE